MTKRMRLILLSVLGLFLVLTATLFGLYISVQHVPTFYHAALHVDPAKQEAASKQMVQQVATLTTAFKKEGAWETRITAEQINGWFAYDAAKSHAALLERFRDPRVSIDANRLIIASVLEIGGHSTVVSLTVEPYVPEPNVLALRIIKARAGLLPVPLRLILDRVTKAATDWQLHLEWRQNHDDPVALLTLPEDLQGARHHAIIETLQLDKGEIYLAGVTKQGAPKHAPAALGKDATSAKNSASKEQSSAKHPPQKKPEKSPSSKQTADLKKIEKENPADPPSETKKAQNDTPEENPPASKKESEGAILPPIEPAQVED